MLPHHVPPVADPRPPAAEATADTRTRVRSRVQRVIATEIRDGTRLGLVVRRWALFGIAALVGGLVPFPDSLYYLAVIGVFLAGGELLLHGVRTNRARRWHAYAFVTWDMVLLVFTILYPNPLAVPPYPASLAYFFGNVVYLFVMLALLAFVFRPQLVLWGGLVAAAGWGGGVWLILQQPGHRVLRGVPDGDLDALIAGLGDPHVIDLGARIQEIGVLLIVAGVLAVAVWRSQRLVMRQALVERERANLARYFPPAMVDRLATRDAPLAEPREAEVAVLFVDVVGFTGWAERRRPGEVVARLRDLHGRLEGLIFEHGGTLDKFIGDGVMATFGTPDPQPDDAARAVACVRAIRASFAAPDDLPLAIGLHLGPVIMGDVGSERRMEFAVLGDTVNVASRLERLARAMGVRAVLSDAVVRRAGMATTDMQRRSAVRVRGRDGALDLWTL